MPMTFKRKVQMPDYIARTNTKHSKFYEARFRNPSGLKWISQLIWILENYKSNPKLQHWMFLNETMRLKITIRSIVKPTPYFQAIGFVFWLACTYTLEVGSCLHLPDRHHEGVAADYADVSAWIALSPPAQLLEVRLRQMMRRASHIQFEKLNASHHFRQRDVNAPFKTDEGKGWRCRKEKRKTEAKELEKEAKGKKRNLERWSALTLKS